MTTSGATSLDIDTPYDSAIENIHIQFKGLHEILNERENTLIAYIERKKAEHFKCHSTNLSKIQDLVGLNGYIREHTKNNQIMKSKIAENQLEINALKSEIVKSIEELSRLSWGNMEYVSLCDTLKKIDFELQDTAVVESSSNSSEILEKDISRSGVVQYTEKHTPILQGGKYGETFDSDEIYHPNHLAIDESTQNIYISDFRQHCIVVFDNKANFLHKFNSNIRYPRAIACRNNKVYLIENSHSMRHLAFKSFTLIPKISPIRPNRLKIPADLTIVSAFDVDQDENWYICNRQCNKLDILSKSTFYSFSSGPPLQSPTAVKVRDVLYILESQRDQTPQIIVLSFKGDPIKTVPLYGIIEPLYFDVDLDGNFIVSDGTLDSIAIFQNNGAITHRIQSSQSQPISHPKGIAVSANRNIIVITNNVIGCLLIF